MTIQYSKEVSTALKNGSAIVALESTIIAHGMPFPENVETAREVERIIRNEGATPATIAILNGKMHVGLEDDQLEYLGHSKNVAKVSLRDMPYVISKSLNGATTVASTMRIAAMAGLKIFVTGGTGGVHRGAQQTFDISADLTEMASNSVAVVSAGVKSILDIGATLEVLETLGIPVITFNHDFFPSFYSRSSPFKSPLRLDEPKSIADLIHVRQSLAPAGSVLIANPLPVENEIPYEKMEVSINKALSEADSLHITGKDCTPFLLKRIAELTSGDSLEANRALIRNNAKLGARIAIELYTEV